ncbi:MAG: hypothetical protein HKP58_13760 [Desulfatitalea sp.]|nr:hypothetical protein [Desulfatitalea sp.]NNK01468.1 hypothetical protein [Desulfatitalea sp.]
MSKVISLDEKLKMTADQKAAAVQRQKIRAVRQVFQCTQCASKCERCGASLAAAFKERESDPKIPYQFCASCTEEYLDYIHCLQGGDDSTAYWHNHQWLKVWQTWIEYQGAVDQYIRTKEFRRLVNELGHEGPGCD